MNKWRTNNVLVWDVSGYYLYLPATFIYHDLTHLSFYPVIDSQYHPSAGEKWYGLFETELPGRRANKYTCGTAIFELPFFLIAHATVKLTGTYPADGYSAPYLLAVCLATVFWSMMGLFILRKLLLLYYSGKTAFIVLLLLAFGTNLYDYTAFEPGMSHNFSFFIFAAILYCTAQFYRQKLARYLLLLGLLIALAFLTRPTSLIIVLIPLLWSDAGCRTLNDKMNLLKQNRRTALLSFLFFVLLASIQLVYWRVVTGHWLYYSYKGEGFDFMQPHIIDGLISYRKGWFIYTPMAFVAIIGFLFMYKSSNRSLLLPLVSFLLLDIYIVFSWHTWFYGFGFSARAMLESLALLSIPLAAMVDWLILRPNKRFRFVAFTILFLLIGLNIFQTYQYARGVIKGDSMDRSSYYRHFFDIEVEYEKP